MWLLQRYSIVELAVSNASNRLGSSEWSCWKQCPDASSATASMMEAEEKLFDAARRGQALAVRKMGDE